MLQVLYQSIFTPLEVIHSGRKPGRLSASVAAVLTCAVLGSGAIPMLSYSAYGRAYGAGPDIWGMLSGFAVSVLTWLAVCALFRLFSILFAKGIRFGQIVSVWGLSYLPNFFCLILYGLLMLFPRIHNGSGFTAFVIGFLFILFLVWKAIFYFMFMRFVLRTTLREIMILTAVSAAAFAVLLMIGFKAGIQVPML